VLRLSGFSWFPRSLLVYPFVLLVACGSEQPQDVVALRSPLQTSSSARGAAAIGGESSAGLGAAGVVGLGGAGGVSGASTPSCVPTGSIDSVCDRRDEDCDGRIDEDCDFGPADCPAGSHVIEGTAGDDVLTGTNGSDCILGYGGNDTIRGGSGNDFLFGGPGNDYIESDDGKDVIHAGPGDDEVDATNAKDSEIYGDAGDDLLIGGNGKDVLHGGPGNDRLFGGNGRDELYGDGCHDLIVGGEAPDTGAGGDGFDVCVVEFSSGCERMQVGPACTEDSTCGAGQRCARSVGFCVPASADACGSCVPLSSDDRTCDGVDDDCDGRVDDDFVNTTSSCGVGECAATGTITCSGGHSTDSCHAGAPAAADASCDGLDNDCDGRTDEHFAPQRVSCGAGACTAAGSTSCVSGHIQNDCTPSAPSADDASCNGIDDDCNGAIDEDFSVPPTTCGVGACAASGTVSCEHGAQVDTCTPRPAEMSDANCNGVDDDCDGRTDENYVSVASTCGIGACAATGSVTCAHGHTNDSCQPGVAAADDTTCDGIDDDCNGTADEDYVAVASSCGIGACTGIGQLSCVDGRLVNQCTPGSPAGFDSSCDGIDDDCDGRLDEDFSPQPVTCGVGACAANGTTACVSGRVLNSCTPKVPSANDVTCNGIDDDCDGSIDEEYPSQPTTCGIGACAAHGSTHCAAGTVNDSCTPGIPMSDANCNGVDEDCDGAADQDFQASCAGSLLSTCVAGQVVTHDCNDHNLCTGQETCSAGACQPGTSIALDDGDGCTTDTCDPQTGAVKHTDKAVGATCSDGRSCNGLERCALPCAAVPDGVLAHWPAEGNAEDAFGPYDGTLNGGIAFGQGVAGQAFHLDGVNDYVRAVVPMAGRNAGTLELWLRTTRQQDAYVISIPKSTGGGNGWDIHLTSGHIDACARLSSTGNCVTVARNYADGAWHQFAATLAASTLRFYIDGQLEGSVAGINGTLFTDHDEVDIGRFGTFGAYFAGDLDETRIYTRALTGAEIASRYAAKGAACRLACTPGASPFADDDCNGLDDDCDGDTDEAYEPATTRCGIGACQALGQLTCVAGRLQDTCVPHGAGAADTCNGLDDDCDGRTDEDFVSTTVVCGSGTCGATAPTACVHGAVVDLCFSAGADNDCDGLDDDCDGLVDEAFTPRCEGSVRQTCEFGALVDTQCDDGNACNGVEACRAGACVTGPVPTLDDANVCTIDSCDSVLGLRHQPVAFGTACADGDACNGVETCWVCRESANLIRNAGFEDLDGLPLQGQGVLTAGWYSMNLTPDVYSNDGSVGVFPADFGNFPGVTAIQGKRFAAGWSSFTETMAQELDRPLRPGQSYRLSAKLRQAKRSDLNNSGGYTVAVTNYYGPQSTTYPRVTLGTLGPTVSSAVWASFSFEFVAPPGIETMPVIVFIPTRAGSGDVYPGLDDLALVETCAQGDAAPACKATEPPALDDGNPCTTDSCAPIVGFSHTPTPGAACNGSGTCNAASSCSNRLPVFTSEPLRLHWVSPNSATLYRYPLTATDPDPGSTITFSVVTGPPGMSVSAGVVTWNASFGQVGGWPVRLRATDEHGGFTEQRFILNTVWQHEATSTPHPPRITSRPIGQAYQGAVYRYDVEAIDDDPQGLRFSLSSGVPAGMLIDPITGVVTWTPSAVQLGSFEIEVRVTDAGGSSAAQIYQLMVANGDDAPTFVSSPSNDASVAIEYRYQPIVRDLDGDVPAFSLAVGPGEMTIDPSTGLLTWLPTDDDVGPHAVSLSVVSGTVTITQTYTLTVHAPQELQSPTISSTPPGSVLEGQTYHYAMGASDPNAGDVLQYVGLILPEGARLDPVTGDLVWVPRSGQLGSQTFRVAVTDGLYTVGQEWTVSVVSHNEPPLFISSPEGSARIEQLYEYRCVASDPDADTLEYELAAAPAGMSIHPTTGVVQWTPSADQLGTHQVVVLVRDPLGAFATQTFGLTVGVAAPANQAPEFVSVPEIVAVSGGLYTYVAEAIDPDGVEPLSYTLVEGPAGMSVNAQSGEVRWLATTIASYQVVLRATDPEGARGEQSFGLAVYADTQAPRVQLTASLARFAPGEITTLSVSAQDQVSVASVQLAIDGAPWPLDAQGKASYRSQQPGPHRAIATATDPAGHSASAELILAVTQAGDSTAPTAAFGAGIAEGVYTYIHDIVGSVADDNLLRYTLSVQREGTSSWTVLNSGTHNVTNGVVGKLDATRLVNGIYQLRLLVEDINGLTTELIRPVRVDGGAKVGVVQLSFTDVQVGMHGFPISVVRTYDSRRRDEEGDFGHGWTLDIHEGSIQHNRPLGSYFALFSGDTGASTFEFPCQRMNEQRPHITEVRISDREWYIFRPTLANTEAYAGGCVADMFFELVDGSAAGAQLVIVGNNTVRADKSLRLANQTIDENIPMNLLDAYTLEDYNPTEFQLLLADGRLFDLTLDRGIVRFADRNNHWMSIENDRLVHSDGRQIDIDRDAQGRVTRVRDPKGQTVTYSYDAQGDLNSVRDQQGLVTRYVYHSEPAHHLQSIVRPDGIPVAAFEYNSEGRLAETCDAENHCSRYDYDLSARSQVVKAPDDTETKYEYDARGNVTRQSDALGNSVTFAYDADDNVIEAHGPDGSVAKYAYDASRNLLRRELPHEADENPADFVYTYTYTARNDRETVTLPSGGVIAYTYDASGNLNAVRDGDGNAIEQRTYDANGRLQTRADRFGTTIYSNYDVSGAPRTITDPFGVAATLAYDTLGNLLSRSERGQTMTMQYDALSRPTFTDYGNGARVRYEYGDPGDKRWTALEGPTFGRLERSFTARGLLGSWKEPNGDVFSRVYDAAGRVSEEIDALGNRTLHGYDAAGRLAAITDETLGATTLFERDATGRVTKTTDALGHETTTAYKLGGRLERTTNARGRTTSFDRSPLSASITDALNRTTVTSVSTYGLPGSTTYPGGAETASSYLGTTRLDGAQQFPTSFEDEQNRSREYSYDAKSGLTSASDLAGQNWHYQYAPAAHSSVSYDVFSGNVSIANADGGARAYQSSASGTEYRDIATTGQSAGGNFSHMLSQVTSPMGEVTKFERGTNGRINKVTYPDGGTRQIAYDAANRPKTITLPQGTVVSLGYDALGRETSRTTSTGEFRTFSYGPNNRVESMTDNTGTTVNGYDQAGRLSGITYPSGASVTYARDVLGRTTDVRVKTGPTAALIDTHYVYDSNGNLAQITDPNGGITGFTYDDADRLTQRVLPNNVLTTYSYDNRDRVLSIVHRNAANVVLASVAYERSPSGEPSKITREDGTYVVIEYDTALRVSKESEHDHNGVLISETSYGYDLDGNRSSKTTLTGSETYSYAAGFKLTGITSTSGNEAYGHDAGGRLTSVTKGGVARTIEYDSFDHITRIVDGGIEVERYTFDGMGRRVGVNNGASIKRFLIAPNLGDGYDSPQAVVDGSGNLIASYVYAGEYPIMKIGVGGQVDYLLADTMGSVIGKSSNSGASTARIKYDGFGNVTHAVGAASGIDPAIGTEQRFQGMQLDAATGTYFVRARSYDARTGTFVSRDPNDGFSFVPESFGLYAFCFQNTFINVDPTGRETLLDLTAAGAVESELAVTEAESASAFANIVKNGLRGRWFESQVINAISKVASVGKNTYAVASVTLGGVGQRVIPDLYAWGERFRYGLVEIKFVQEISLSPQLQAQYNVALDVGAQIGQKIPFNLIVGPTTTYISGPLQRLIAESGGVILEFSPELGTFVQWFPK
jgi:RHS repeat-associated protein